MPKIPSYPVDGWTSGTVQACRDSDSNRVEVPALITGPLAVCQNPHTPENGGKYCQGKWAVVHVTTGLTLLAVESQEDAKEIAYYLRLKIPGPFREPDRQSIVKEMPFWVEPWLKQCYEEQKYIPIGSPPKPGSNTVSE